MIALRSVALNAGCPIALGRAMGAVTGIAGLVRNALMERRKLSKRMALGACGRLFNTLGSMGAVTCLAALVAMAYLGLGGVTGRAGSVCAPASIVDIVTALAVLVSSRCGGMLYLVTVIAALLEGQGIVGRMALLTFGMAGKFSGFNGFGGVALDTGGGFVFGECVRGVAFCAFGARMEGFIAVGLGMAGTASLNKGCLGFLGMGIVAAGATLMFGIGMGGF